MKIFIPYGIGAIIGALLLALAQTQCADPEPPETVRDTTVVAGDTVVITRQVPVDRPVIVYREMPAPTDDSPCWPLLKAAIMDADSLAQQCWYLSELEVDGEITTPGITGRIGWSMPRFLGSGQGFVYDLRATTTTTNVYPEPPARTFFSRFGYGLHAGVGGAMTPAGTYPAVYVGVGFQYDLTGAF